MGSSAIAIAAMALLSLSSLTSSVAGAGEEEMATKFFLKCFAVEERFLRGDSFSELDRELIYGCGRSLDLMHDAYVAVGRLRPAYVEALKRWFNGNQTLIDREICALDDVRSRRDIRCANHTRFIHHKYFLDDGD